MVAKWSRLRQQARRRVEGAGAGVGAAGSWRGPVVSSGW